MKLGALTLAVAGGLLAGCASHVSTLAPASTESADAVTATHRVAYEDSSATALVFDPPVAAGEPVPELARDLRQPSAFVGFDGPITTNYWIHTDDSQVSDWGTSTGGGLGRNSGVGDRYERRAVIDRVGVSYR